VYLLQCSHRGQRMLLQWHETRWVCMPMFYPCLVLPPEDRNRLFSVEPSRLPLAPVACYRWKKKWLGSELPALSLLYSHILDTALIIPSQTVASVAELTVYAVLSSSRRPFLRVIMTRQATATSCGYRTGFVGESSLNYYHDDALGTFPLACSYVVPFVISDRNEFTLR